MVKWYRKVGGKLNSDLKTIWIYLLVSNLTKKQTQALSLPTPSGTYRAMFACSTTALFLCTEKSTRKTHPPLAQ